MRGLSWLLLLIAACASGPAVRDTGVPDGPDLPDTAGFEDAAGPLDLQGDAALDPGEDGIPPADVPGADGVEPDVADPDVADPDVPAPGPRCPGLPGEMVLVPAGPFRFGPEALPADLPEAFCIDRTEVTAAAFVACVQAGGCAGYADWALCQQPDPVLSPNQCLPDRDLHPANWIDWYRAEAFCRWAGRRLPSQLEWEKAARGEDGRAYPWGDVLSCEHAHQGRGPIFHDCLGVAGLPDRPIEVGSYPLGASPYGVLDLCGNVKEWVDYRQDRSRLPPEDAPAVSKGGGFDEGEWLVTTHARDDLLGPGITSQGHGFRCAADPI